LDVFEVGGPVVERKEKMENGRLGEDCELYFYLFDAEGEKILDWLEIIIREEELCFASEIETPLDFVQLCSASKSRAPRLGSCMQGLI
jgi:hypothetical protein